jgi:hypothetical protein
MASRKIVQAPILAIRRVSRETSRLAVFLWMAPTCIARNSEGSAPTSAICTAVLSPLGYAHARAPGFVDFQCGAILRIAFLADLVLAIDPFLDVRP